MRRKGKRRADDAHVVHATMHHTIQIYPVHTAGDGKCPICDSLVRPATLVRICDECNYGSNAGRCVVCGNPGISDAYYCKECVMQEKDVSGWVGG